MNYLDAQKKLAETIAAAGSKVNPYFWRLSGDAPNSLCRFLGIEEEELKLVLRLCKIYTGEKDNFSKNNFELLMSQCGCDWTTFRLYQRVERFIKIGDGSVGEVVLPKNMYDVESNLCCYPVEDQHIRIIRTKSQKGSLPELLEVSNKGGSEVDPPTRKEHWKKKQQLDHYESPNAILYEYVKELVSTARRTGDGKISQRSARQLQRLIGACVDVAAKELLHSALEKYALQKNSCVFEGTQSESSSLMLTSPDKASSAAVETIAVTPATTVDQESVDLSDDEESISSTTTDEFLAELKDEVVLQCLLHKRIHEKKERVFRLEHRNGRKLLVVVPPDTQSISTFEVEAKKTNWVDTMLNTEDKVQGMLSYLAKTYPESFVAIGKTRRLSMRIVALNTNQTLALARVGKLNDVQLQSMRSFLRHIGKVNLQQSKKEQARIDMQVGLHRTKDATYGSYLHEWSQTKGKEKKPPEQVYYWNAKLSSEIEAEVDLYLQHLFLQGDKTYNSIPSINYIADGFDKPGVTILFGGDHGDKHCPISCKINLSPPQVRKEMKVLGYQCPLLTFASVQCTKDAFDLMDSTVMPIIKQQLIDLKGSSIVTVYHWNNYTKIFRSYTVPAAINPQTVAFQQGDDDGDDGNGSSIATMTFAYEQGSFGSITIDDPVFDGVKHFQLGAKVVISTFNELFIGNLAFLAMLIGMNNSSGAHCLMCMMTRSEFNCPLHHQLELRTKEKLVECLEQFILLSNNNNRKQGPANYKGVNANGLWDIDPQQIVLPILHCPMGLVDKVLEAFKKWVHYEVEDFHNLEMDATRSLYRLAKQQHEAAVEALRQSKAVVAANPTNQQAKIAEISANKARIKAAKEETKAREQYDEQLQKHNAKKASLNQKFETVYRQNGVKREHYHGGKFNGVNCIRIMEKCKDIYLGGNDDTAPGFLQKCLQTKVATITDDDVTTTCQKFCRLLGLLDAIWSKVRGIDHGLLPTVDQSNSLEAALHEAKALWVEMDLTTLQPKWHLTFDGHLLDQFKRYGGLADKSDESIEKGHQTLKALRERFRGGSSYEQREGCIRRELRRRRSPEIQRTIDK
jgi:hypothetical protein